ncbi:MAG: DUF1232 domain-containing protein [Deltaproteobacteria bacterium]|nr:DUF1232 domain-containing protein [Deltaproteobacteria bacterium]
MAEARVEVNVRAREKRSYDRLRDRILKFEPGSGSGVRDVALLFPDLVMLLLRLLRDPRVPIGSKAVALLGVSYALAPLDLLPEILLGPIGLLDDLIVLAAALSRILNHVHPDLVRAHWSGQGDALDAVQRVTAWAESWLGGALARIFGFRRIGVCRR